MGKEKSSVEILKDISKREGWGIKIEENIVNERFGHSSRSIIIRNKEYSESYFISAQTLNFDKYRIYSGVFLPFSGHVNFKLFLRKRDFFDKLSFRRNRLRFKLGSSSFDSKVYTETNNEIETHKLLSSSKLQLEIMEFLDKADRLFIGINEINPDQIKDLKGKVFLSVFMSLEWMLDKKLIDAAFMICHKLGMKLKTN